MKCRKPICDIETGAYALSRDESGGCPFTGLTVSGMKATRAWSAAAAWNVGRQAPIPPLAWFGVVRGRAPGSRNCEVLSTDAGRAGGPVRSSDAVSYTHLRAHETGRNLVCRLLLEKKKKKKSTIEKK